MVVKGLKLKLGDSVNGTLNLFILCKLGSAWIARAAGLEDRFDLIH